MFQLLKIFEDFTINYMIGEPRLILNNDLSYYYDLHQLSIFLHIDSGNGVSALHTAMKYNCLSYGLDRNLDTI